MVQDGLWKILGILICVIMLFIVPTLSVYERQDDIAYNIVLTEANALSQRVRETGFLDRKMIDDFMVSILATGNTYEVEFEHLAKVFGNNQGEMEVYYEGTYTQDIYNLMELSGRYAFHIGDFFYVKIKNRSMTKSQSVRHLFGLKSGGGATIYIVSGGVIRYGDT